MLRQFTSLLYRPLDHAWIASTPFLAASARSFASPPVSPSPSPTPTPTPPPAQKAINAPETKPRARQSTLTTSLEEDLEFQTDALRGDYSLPPSFSARHAHVLATMRRRQRAADSLAADTNAPTTSSSTSPDASSESVAISSHPPTAHRQLSSAATAVRKAALLASTPRWTSCPLPLSTPPLSPPWTPTRSQIKRKSYEKRGRFMIACLEAEELARLKSELPYREFPEFKAGDELEVTHVNNEQGANARSMRWRGTCIWTKRMDTPRASFGVLNMLANDMWEKSWFLYSKDILKIQVIGKKKLGNRKKMYWVKEEDPKLFKV